MELVLLSLKRAQYCGLIVAAAACAPIAEGAATAPQSPPRAPPTSSEAPKPDAGTVPARSSGPAPAEGGVAALVDATAPDGGEVGASALLDAGAPPRATPGSGAASDAAVSAPLPLPEGSTVLHIGDSMAGALGVELNHELKRHKVKGILRFQTASYIPGWAWGKELPLYIAQFKPDLVLITLGTNEVKILDPSQRIPLIKRIVRQLGGRPCVWVAPPVWAPEKGLYQVIHDNIAPCRYMDTQAVYPDMPRLKDKIHPTIPARAVWAKRVVEWLAKERRPTADRAWELAPEAAEP